LGFIFYSFSQETKSQVFAKDIFPITTIDTILAFDRGDVKLTLHTSSYYIFNTVNYIEQRNILTGGIRTKRFFRTAEKGIVEYVPQKDKEFLFLPSVLTVGEEWTCFNEYFICTVTSLDATLVTPADSYTGLIEIRMNRIGELDNSQLAMVRYFKPGEGIVAETKVNGQFLMYKISNKTKVVINDAKMHNGNLIREEVGKNFYNNKENYNKFKDFETVRAQYQVGFFEFLVSFSAEGKVIDVQYYDQDKNKKSDLLAFLITIIKSGENYVPLTINGTPSAYTSTYVVQLF
jgi:hypothetical protein